jgi:hypothetical protein
MQLKMLLLSVAAKKASFTPVSHLTYFLFLSGSTLMTAASYDDESDNRDFQPAIPNYDWTRRDE